MKTISSYDNSYIKYARNLKQRKYREKEGKYLVEGIRLLEDALQAGIVLEAVFFTEKLRTRARGEVLLKRCQQLGSSCYQVPDSLLDSLADTDTPQGIIGIACIPRLNIAEIISGTGLLLVVDQVQDPGNLGTILRTAEAVGCEGVLLSVGTVDPYNSKVLRASMGAAFRLPLRLDVELLELLKELKAKGYQIVAADLATDNLYWQVGLTLPGALVVGNEGRGICPEVLAVVDDRVKIPLREGVDSLNVAVASGIILYDWLRQAGGQLPG
ncbi:MAG: TrmH family RNA methyltransferase [bacterium]|jgi:TrmH family RNA methyltransferase